MTMQELVTTSQVAAQLTQTAAGIVNMRTANCKRGPKTDVMLDALEEIVTKQATDLLAEVSK